MEHKTADQLSEAKRRLLEKRLRGEVKPQAAGPGRIRRFPGGPVYPMSWNQERLWFLDQLEPGNPFYNIASGVLVSARIDVAVLERAFTEVVRRHEALHTAYRMIDGVPSQIVVEPYEVKIEVEDLRGPNGEPASEDLIRRTISREAAKPFDISTGVVVAAKLFRVSEPDYALFFNVHHIATDGWAMPIFTREMEQLYEAFAKGRPSPLKELEIHYTDYSMWQREHLKGEVLERHLNFWRDHLGGAPTAIDLPTDRPRPPVQTHRGEMFRFFYPKSLVERLKELGRLEGASLNMVLMAGFNLMLQRYSGQEDVVVGTLVGNRNRLELEPLIGFFVNTVAVRTRLEGDPTFRELLRQVRTSVLDADAHQEVPFDMIVDAVKAPRDPSRNPVFQVMFFHHTFVSIHHLEDAAFASSLNLRSLFQESSVSLVDMGTTKFDLMLATIEMESGLSSVVEYATDLFDRETVARMMDHLRHLLESAAAAPDAPVSTLEMALDTESRALAEWSAGPALPAGPDTVLAILDAQAAKTPDVAAVEWKGESLTYRELHARADRLAARLRSIGAGPERVVGVCLERGIDLVVSLLAVLKTGGAYVPLDPDLPAERLAYILRDASAIAVVTRGGIAEKLPADVRQVFVEVDEAPSVESKQIAPDADNVAWVIYTSGSTGQPKGVAVRHGGGAAFLRYMADAFPVQPGDRVVGSTSTSFDVHIADLVYPIATGATLVLVEDALSLAEPGAADGVVHAAMVPTAATELARMGAFPATLKRLVLGGEALSDDLARRIYESTPVGAVFNGYGPTEDTTYSTVQAVPRGGRVTIGRPIAGGRAYVLDARGRPCPVGVPGELFLGGAGVTRGYVGRPGMTAERYLPDPFEPGARMYRTGDRARWLPTGELEYLGRLDHQVKVRGHRIELGEVEVALRRHPVVRDAAVNVHDDGTHGRQLAAYLVVDGEAPSAMDLRLWLLERLPDYMIPSAFVTLEALPRTTSGKVDRKALPAPAAAGRLAAGAYEAPRGPVEETLAKIWADVLGIERVGVSDNFFALGGDSILSIQIVARAAQAGVKLATKQLFTHQTVAELAAVAGATAGPTTAEQGEVTGAVPPTAVQRWFLEQETPEPNYFNLTAVFDASARIDPALAEHAAAIVLAHHDALRMRLRQTADGGWEQEIAPVSPETPFSVADLSHVPAAERDAAFRSFAIELQSSLELDETLIRFALVDFGADVPQRLVITAHHLVIDTISWGLVSDDFETAYGQLSRGEDVVLPPKTTSFRHWAERIVEHAGSPAVRGEAAYWLALSDTKPLPVDFAGGSNTEGDIARVDVELSEEDTKALLTEVPPVYGTQINDVLLAALARAFRRWTGERALLVDLEAHGREELFDDVDLSRTVGWFTAIHPVRLELPEGNEPGETLKGVKEQLRAVPGKGVGYGLLRYLGDADVRDALRAKAHPQVSFNYLGQLDAAVRGKTDALFEGVNPDIGPQRSPRAPRLHLLGVDAMVVDGRLLALFAYAPTVHSAETARRLADGFVEALRELIEHCRHPEAGGFTPSDFALAGLDQGALDALLAEIGD